MKKLKPTKRIIMTLLAMFLLLTCKHEPLPPSSGPSVLDTYHGDDEMVLKVIKQLKNPQNKLLLNELEKQATIDWKYEALITSRFLDGFTLRFTTGDNEGYLDAEINAETKAIKLYSSQMQQQRDALVKQSLNKLKANGTLDCFYTLYFEISASNYQLLSYSLLKDLLIRGLNNGGLRVTFVDSNTDYLVVTAIESFSPLTNINAFVNISLNLVKLYITSVYNTSFNVNKLIVTNSCDMNETRKQSLRQELNAILKPGESFEFTDGISYDAPSYNSAQELRAMLDTRATTLTSQQLDNNTKLCIFRVEVGSYSYYQILIKLTKTIRPINIPM